MTHFLILIAAINVACVAIKMGCWFWKTRKWKPSPFLLPVPPPPGWGGR